MASTMVRADCERIGLGIPRTFHRIWLGGQMPPKFERYGRTWLEHHPGWEMITWTDDTLPRLRNQVQFDRATTHAGKADIARYEILARYGGVYLDCDFECLSSIDDLLVGVKAFSAREDADWVAIGIMGCVPGHSLFEEAVESIPRRLEARPDAPPNETTGPHLMTELLAGRSDATIFGPEKFYPYHYTETAPEPQALEQAYAVHHWAHSWATPRRELHRIGVRMDLDSPAVALLVMGVYGRMLRADDPAELALVLDQLPTEQMGARILDLAAQVIPNLGDAAQIVAYETTELEGLDLDVLVTSDDLVASAESIAAAVEHIVAVRDHLRDHCGSAACPAAPTLGASAARPAPPGHERLEQVFSTIYRDDLWSQDNMGCQVAGVPRSGPGSLVERSQPVIDFLRQRIASDEVRSIVDVGCGDLTYIAAIEEITTGRVDYSGIDVVPALIAEHRRLPWGRFEVGNVVDEGFRISADIVIAKDVLFHLASEDAERAVTNLMQSDWRWLVLTSDPTADNNARVLDMWHFAPIDLTSEPFGLEPRLVLPRSAGGVFLVLER
jgi:hypothetical protein